MVADEIAAANAFADWKILTENEEGALTAERALEVANFDQYVIDVATSTTTLEGL